MRIEIDNSEIIDLKDFELSWRWEKTHNPCISDLEKAQIEPVSEVESKRLNKVIDYFEIENNLRKGFIETDWISANNENDENINTFRQKLSSIIDTWNDNVIITWNRTTTLKTTKKLFLKYWDDFCYPSSDDVTIISEESNWVMFYRHFGVANIWTRKKSNTEHGV